MSPRIVVFGATGYTGHLVAKSLVAQGLKPVLAARNAQRLANLARSLGGLDIRIANIEDQASVRAMIEPGDILVSTVGPFTRFGKPALDAAVEKKAHYIDCSGEPGFIRSVYETYHEAAVYGKIAMLSAFGYDFVPGHCAAAVALERGGPLATHVEVSYFITGDHHVKLSEGSQVSSVTTMMDAGYYWHDHNHVEGYGGADLKRFRVDGKMKPAVSLPSSEHLYLPRVYPHLDNVDVYVGWFGYYSYAITQLARLQSLMTRLPFIRRAMDVTLPLLLKSEGRGPNSEERSRMGTHVIAVAYDCNGRRLAQAELKGVDHYTFTADIMAWGAKTILDGKLRKYGAVGPVGAFGLDTLVEGCKMAGLELR